MHHSNEVWHIFWSFILEMSSGFLRHMGLSVWELQSCLNFKKEKCYPEGSSTFLQIFCLLISILLYDVNSIFLSNSIKCNWLRVDSRQLFIVGTFEDIKKNIHRLWKHLQRKMTKCIWKNRDTLLKCVYHHQNDDVGR